MTLFPSPETATSAFVFIPPNPSYAVEGKDFTLKWNYTLDSSLNVEGFPMLLEVVMIPLDQEMVLVR